MTDFRSVVRALMRTGLTYMTLADELALRGIAVSHGHIANIARGDKSRCMFELGDGLVRMLAERDPSAHERLYVQTRPDYQRRSDKPQRLKNYQYGGTA